MLLTIKQAEKVTGYSYNALLGRIKSGTIPTTRHGKFHMIEEKDLIPHMKKGKSSVQVTQPEIERSHQGANFIQESIVELERDRVKVCNRILDLMLSSQFVTSV